MSVPHGPPRVVIELAQSPIVNLVQLFQVGARRRLRNRIVLQTKYFLILSQYPLMFKKVTDFLLSRANAHWLEVRGVWMPELMKMAAI